MLERAALATCDFYIHAGSASTGSVTGILARHICINLAIGKPKLPIPYNAYEPCRFLGERNCRSGIDPARTCAWRCGREYTQAGLTVVQRLTQEPYLSTELNHEGILLHSVYHRPNGWDYVPPGARIPCGESSMWGDYHLLEALLLVSKLAETNYYTFF